MRKIVIVLLLLPSFAFASPYYDTTVTDTGFGGTINPSCDAPNVVVLGLVSTTDDVTNVTLGGVAMTKISSSAHMINRYAMMYYLNDVTSGTLSVTGGTAMGVTDNVILRAFCGLNGPANASYYEADAVSTNYTHALTTTVNSWYVMSGTNSAITPTDGTNCSLRGTTDAWMCDSNALLTAGSNSQAINGGAATWGIVQAGFIEVATSSEEETDVASTSPDTTTKGDLGLIGLILLTFAWYAFIVHLHGKFFPVKK